METYLILYAACLACLVFAALFFRRTLSLCLLLAGGVFGLLLVVEVLDPEPILIDRLEWGIYSLFFVTALFLIPGTIGLVVHTLSSLIKPRDRA